MSKKTLFLDRDGVINRQIIGGYVTHLDEFEFLPGVLDAMAILAKQFDYIFLVTNQQGIGKGVFSISDLDKIHEHMLEKIDLHGGRIDKIYFCPELESTNSQNRKPNPGMGLQALQEFPDIELNATIMVGDSLLDMQFGKNLGVKTVFLTNGKPVLPEIEAIADCTFTNLLEFSMNR
jgi:histidinol-phosphate phosphatase family domain/HAD-superfamily hydrolase, subfamily IIIA